MLLLPVSFGNPAVVPGGVSPLLFYGAIIAGIAASIIIWRYFNHRKKEV